ncbi:zinc finger protein-like protein [Dinothrombium tinctorium]|uniref:Zinc finger protein-like protein n=1 Tax=Dinothrombium tinctorium TaxID=1965070 RepID=A0A3S3NUH6_9ACAR|nr:zinc finger protein-like protein [Dinothrombium tinctorium]
MACFVTIDSGSQRGSQEMEDGAIYSIAEKSANCNVSTEQRMPHEYDVNTSRATLVASAIDATATAASAAQPFEASVSLMRRGEEQQAIVTTTASVTLLCDNTLATATTTIATSTSTAVPGVKCELIANGDCANSVPLADRSNDVLINCNPDLQQTAASVDLSTANESTGVESYNNAGDNSTSVEQQDKMSNDRGNEIADYGDGFIRMTRLETKSAYSCHIEGCEQRFDSKHHVYRHIRVKHKKEIIFVNENGEEEKLESRKVVKFQRKYTCDFPGCKWVFTRSNHIFRHQAKAHPGFKSGTIEKTVVCDFDGCGQSFTSVSSMQKHKRNVHIQKEVQKSNGPQMEGMHLRSSSKKLLYTFSEIEIEKSYVCDFEGCEQRFARRDSLNKHFRKVHTPKPSEPPPEPPPAANESNENGNSTLTEQDISASDGTSASAQEINANSTKSKKKSRQPFVCDQENCQKSFSKYAQLLKHKIQSHNFEKVPRKPRSESVNGTSLHAPPPKDPIERPFVCTYENCDWSFKRSYHLERHMETHQRKTKPVEEVVKILKEQPNESQSDEQQTQQRQQNEKETPDYNMKKNEWQSRLRQNKPTTIKYVETIALAVEKDRFKDPDLDRPFQCDFPGCGKKFKKSSQLDSHYFTHSGPSNDQLKRTPPKKRPYDELDGDRIKFEDGYEGEGEENGECNEKPKAKRRRKREEERGAYVCDVEGCEKKFSRNCELTRHKLNHVDVWPFVCEHPGCGRKFKRKDIYRNHQKTHNKPLDADGKPKSKPRKKPKPSLPVVLNPACNTDVWNATGAWTDPNLNPAAAVSISIINVTLPSQTPSAPALPHSTATTHTFPQSISHQVQNWTQSQGRPTVVQQNWGHPINVNLTPITSPQSWPSVVTRPSVVQATWANAVRQPEPQNQIVTNPTVLETLGLRPSGLATQWITVASNQQDAALSQCRYTTNHDPVPGHPDQREGWTL